MKNAIILVCLLFSAFAGFSQVGIGTKNPDTTSVLDLSSTTKGALFPRMTTTQRTAIDDPAIGLTVFDLDKKAYWYYTGTEWVEMTTNKDESIKQDSSNSRSVIDTWYTQGNVITGSEFIGTTSNHSLEFRANDVRSGFIDLPLMNTFFGYTAGVNTTGQKNVAIGDSSLYTNTTGNNNIAVGSNALASNVSGDENVAIGNDALRSNATKHRNIAIGYKALYLPGASDNLAIGYEASYNGNGPGQYNVAIGRGALKLNRSQSSSTAVGAFAMYHANNMPFGISENTAVGFRALQSGEAGINQGTQNTAIGSFAMWKNTQGSGNVAVGDLTAAENTTGTGNTSVGAKALELNQSGNENVAVGQEALNNNSGSNNTAVGNRALRSNSNGSDNVAMGDSALYANDTGNRNIALGSNALFSNESGDENVAIGNDALRSNATKHRNIAIGYKALYLPGASDNLAIGYEASYNGNGPGQYNVAIGRGALKLNRSQSSSTAVGAFAMYHANNMPFGISENTAVGFRALQSGEAGINQGTQNTAIGSFAMWKNTQGSGNVAVGDLAAAENTTGTGNTSVGAKALELNQSGNENVAVGQEALNNNSGSNNTAVGTRALRSNINGSDNVAMGDSSLFTNNNGNKNIAVGSNALRFNSVGNENVAIGFEALKSTSVSNNTALGFKALTTNTVGIGNTALGSNALNGNNTGNYNTAVGIEAKVSASDFSNATAIGANAYAGASNSLILGSINGINGGTSNTNVGIGTTTPATRLHIANGLDAGIGANSGYLVLGQTSAGSIVVDDNEIMARNAGAYSTLYLQADGGGVRIGGNTPTTHKLELNTNDAFKIGTAAWVVPSDTRLKKDIEPFTDGLDLVRKINPIWFRYNGLNGITDTARFAGIIAQEIQKIAPYMIGTTKSADRDSESYLSYDANSMTYILINAVKEQQIQIQQQQDRITTLEKGLTVGSSAEVENMKAMLVQMQQEIQELKQQR